MKGLVFILVAVGLSWGFWGFQSALGTLIWIGLIGFFWWIVSPNKSSTIVQSREQWQEYHEEVFFQKDPTAPEDHPLLLTNQFKRKGK